MSDLLSRLTALRVDLSDLYIPDDIAGTANEVLYRANAVGRDNGIVEAGLLVREALLSSDTRKLIADAIKSRDEGLLSPGECERMADAIAALLAGVN